MDLNIAQPILLLAVIAGITELLNRLRAKDYWTATTVATAALTGLVFGLFSVEGLTAITGIAAGFAASGALTAIGIAGRRSTPTPTKALEK